MLTCMNQNFCVLLSYFSAYRSCLNELWSCSNYSNYFHYFFALFILWLMFQQDFLMHQPLYPVLLLLIQGTLVKREQVVYIFLFQAKNRKIDEHELFACAVVPDNKSLFEFRLLLTVLEA